MKGFFPDHHNQFMNGNEVRAWNVNMCEERFQVLEYVKAQRYNMRGKTLPDIPEIHQRYDYQIRREANITFSSKQGTIQRAEITNSRRLHNNKASAIIPIFVDGMHFLTPWLRNH